MVVDKSEREDFENSILEQGHKVIDFELIEQEDPIQGAGVKVISGHVTIRRKSTGTAKSYNAGHGSSWPAQFSSDLRLGFFD